MGTYDDWLTGMMEPYGGNTPLFKGDQTDATVTIVQESYDDGMNITRIQTPPRTETSKLMEAINNILGVFGDSCPLLDKNMQEPSDEKKHPGEDGEKDDDVQSGEQHESGKDKSSFESQPDKSRRSGQDDKRKRMEDKDETS